MGPYVLLRLPGGEEALLRPGDRIGRHARCELQLTDQRVSEMHASVSVRGRSLRLLSLRGGIAQNGRVVRDPLLEPGQVLELAPGLPLEVREVHLPARGLALQGPGVPRTVLAGTMSLFARAPQELRAGYRADADAWFFDDGSRWFCEHDGTALGPLEPGPLQLGSWTGELVLEEVEALPATMQGYRERREGLRIESWFDQVRVFRDGRLQLQLTGKKARVMSELAAIGAPADWEAVARTLWPDGEERWAVRKRWDMTLGRLRRALSDAGLRPDLIDADGKGCVSLLLYPDDEVVLRD